MQKDEFRSRVFSNLEPRELPGVALSYFFPFARAAANYASYALWSVMYVSNFHEVAQLMVGMRKSARLKFRDGAEFEFLGGSFKRPLYLLLKIRAKGMPIRTEEGFSKASFKFKGRQIELSGPDALGLAVEVFFGGEYTVLRPKGMDVVDIGANIGDTAIFFAASGAKRVVSLEPYPYSYSLAKVNIAKNKLAGKIRLLNAAMGGSIGEITLDEREKSLGGSQMSAKKAGKAVPILTLKKLVEDEDIRDAVLKCDCEGCEYEIFLSSDDNVLRRFRRIMMEYHYGHANLSKKLSRAGFKVSVIRRPEYTFNRGWEKPHARTGIIYAELGDG